MAPAGTIGRRIRGDAAKRSEPGHRPRPPGDHACDSSTRGPEPARGILACAFGRGGSRRNRTSRAIEALRQVDREGKGQSRRHAGLGRADRWRTADQLPTILAAIDGAGPLAANWLRAAVDAIAERQMQRARQAADRATWRSSSAKSSTTSGLDGWPTNGSCGPIRPRPIG